MNRSLRLGVLGHTPVHANASAASFNESTLVVNNAFKKTQQMFDSTHILQQQQPQPQPPHNKYSASGSMFEVTEKTKKFEMMSALRNGGHSILHNNIFSSRQSLTLMRKSEDKEFMQHLSKGAAASHELNLQSADAGAAITISPPQKFTDLLTMLKAKIHFRQWRKYMPSRIQQVLGHWHYNLLSDKTIDFQFDKRDFDDEPHQKNSHSAGGSGPHAGDEGFYMSELKPQHYDASARQMTAKILRYIIQTIPLISASGNFRLIWDVIQLMIIMAFQWFFPLYITFDVPFDHIAGQPLASLMYILLVCDVIVNMNTTYYEKGKQVKDRRRIVVKYLSSSGFIQDMLPLLPLTYDYLVDRITSTLLRFIFLLFVLKLGQMYAVISKIQDRFHLVASINSYMQLLKLLMVHLLISHYFASLWVFVAKQQPNFNWMVKRGINDEGWLVQYINGYYFITLTMITVGYGDITPTTNTEILLCILTMTFACGVFAYSVNEIGTLIQDLRNKQKEIKKNLLTISKYMHDKNISNELKYEIREYLLYYWTEESTKNGEKENIIINQLSDSLKETLVLAANHLVLSDSPVFRDNFSTEILKRTVPLIKEFRCTPEEVIYCEGETDEGSIYFIQKGSVELYIDISTGQKEQFKPLKQLRKGDNFGTIGFFTGLHRTQSVRSLEFTTLLMIKRDEFLALLKEFPQDYERFCFIRDKILISKDYQKLGLRCYSCQSFFHVLNDCPYLHFVPNRFKLIRAANVGENTRESDFHRINILRYRRTLSLQSEIDQQARIYYEENEDLIEYLFDHLESAYDTGKDNGSETVSLYKGESLGAERQPSINHVNFQVSSSSNNAILQSGGGGGYKDYNIQMSLQPEEDDIRSSSVKLNKRRESKRKTQTYAGYNQINPPQTSKPRFSVEELAGVISNSISPMMQTPPMLLPAPQFHRGERKGTIQIQNHRILMKKLSRIPSSESKTVVQSVNGTEKNLSHFATMTLFNEANLFIQVEIDAVKQYTYYYPHNNIDRVLGKNRNREIQALSFTKTRRRSKRSTVRSTNRVETLSMNSLQFKYESQRDNFESELTPQQHNAPHTSKISVFSRHSAKNLSHHSLVSSNLRQHSGVASNNTFNQLCSNTQIKDEENLESNSHSKIGFSSDIELPLPNNHLNQGGDDVFASPLQRKITPSEHPRQDESCKSIRINSLQPSKSYLDESQFNKNEFITE